MVGQICDATPNRAVLNKSCGLPAERIEAWRSQYLTASDLFSARPQLHLGTEGPEPDLADWQPHMQNKPRRGALANRFHDAAILLPKLDHLIGGCTAKKCKIFC